MGRAKGGTICSAHQCPRKWRLREIWLLRGGRPPVPGPVSGLQLAPCCCWVDGHSLGLPQLYAFGQGAVVGGVWPQVVVCARVPTSGSAQTVTLGSLKRCRGQTVKGLPPGCVHA